MYEAEDILQRQPEWSSSDEIEPVEVPPRKETLKGKFKGTGINQVLRPKWAPPGREPLQRGPIQGVPLKGVPPQQAPLKEVPPKGVPLQGTPLQGVPPQQAPLKGVPPKGVPLQGAPLQKAPLKGVLPRGVPLQGTPLQGVPPQQAPLKGVPPKGVPLQGAPLQRASLKGVPSNGVHDETYVLCSGYQRLFLCVFRFRSKSLFDSWAWSIPGLEMGGGGGQGGGEGARKTAPVTKREEISFACMAVFITPLSEHVILDVYLCCIRLRLIFPRMRVW